MRFELNVYEWRVTKPMLGDSPSHRNHRRDACPRRAFQHLPRPLQRLWRGDFICEG
jgi:hypothetical protein